jgi:hypothetical protein
MAPRLPPGLFSAVPAGLNSGSVVLTQTPEAIPGQMRWTLKHRRDVSQAVVRRYRPVCGPTEQKRPRSARNRRADTRKGGGAFSSYSAFRAQFFMTASETSCFEVGPASAARKAPTPRAR